MYPEDRCRRATKDIPGPPGIRPLRGRRRNRGRAIPRPSDTSGDSLPLPPPGRRAGEVAEAATRGGWAGQANGGDGEREAGGTTEGGTILVTGAVDQLGIVGRTGPTYSSIAGSQSAPWAATRTSGRRPCGSPEAR